MSRQLKRAQKVKVPGVVYCTEHGVVHDDTLDPYREGWDSCWENILGERTKDMVHRPVYYGGRAGDWVESP